MPAGLDRLEAAEQIRQLAYRYAIAADMRDLDALVSLYVETIRVGEGTGRSALKRVFAGALRQFTTSVHSVSNHVIDFEGDDRALGLVSCRCEHEVDGRWVVIQLLYHDKYRRVNGRWLFSGRVQSRLYAVADGDPPVGEDKLRWPGTPAASDSYHDAFPAWSKFWESEEIGDARPRDPSRFISDLRGGAGLPAPPVYFFKD